MKKLITLKTFAILTIAMLFSCCGNDCKEEVHLYLPQDFKDCFVFPAGSWWVYAVNGEVYDTLHLVDATLNPPIQPIPGECTVVENYSSAYSTRNYSYFDNGSSCLAKAKHPINNGDTVYFTFIEFEWYLYAAGLPIWCVYVKYFGAGLYGLKSTDEMEIAEQREKGGGYWLEAIRDTNINSISQKLIIFRTLDFEQLPDNGYYIDSLPPFRVYYARGIGLIRKEMYNGDVWQLEKYFINK